MLRGRFCFVLATNLRLRKPFRDGEVRRVLILLCHLEFLGQKVSRT